MIKLQSEFLSELDKRLLALDLGTLRRDEGTKLITETVCTTCRSLKLRYIKEYPAGRILGKRNGYIDFVCVLGLPGNRKLLAIEIDSSNKKFSLEKLVLMEQRGFYPIWIRWNTYLNIEMPPSIHLITLISR